jgi:hypothetical protein
MNTIFFLQFSGTTPANNSIELSLSPLALGLGIALAVALVALLLILRNRRFPASTHIFIVLSLLVFGVLWITQDLMARVRFTDFALPFLLIGGIVTFLVALSLVVVVFKQLGLTSTSTALGLPEGSIRAFIALSLILLFFIIAVFLYLDLASARTETLRGLSKSERDRILAERPEDVVEVRVNEEVTPAEFDIRLSVGRDQTAQDLAKQILTTVITLVVAIASFYFGSTTVAQAQGTADAMKPRSLRIVDPGAFPVTVSSADGSFEPVQITLVTSPAGEPVRWEIEGDDTGAIETVGEGVFNYQPGAPQETVKLRVSLMNSPEVSKDLPLVVPSPTLAQPNAETGAED